MATFSSNTSRVDPYKNFKFRVKWDGRYVAGVSKVSGLKRTTEAVKSRGGVRGSAARKVPGPHTFDAVTLERGVTHDKEFENWASGAQVAGSAPHDIIIEVINEAGQVTLTYKLNRCWVSELQALPDLDANANAVAIESMKLENEGWERVEPQRRRQG
jgi:phage tail-like protein